jgi:uncharacterized membrane protein YcgQ (UPF0703/DUF1980 family)
MNVKSGIFNMQNFILMFFYMIFSVIFTLIHHGILRISNNQLVETHRFLFLPSPMNETRPMNAILGVVGFLL